MLNYFFLYKAEFAQEGTFFTNRFPSLRTFVDKKVGIWVLFCITVSLVRENQKELREIKKSKTKPLVSVMPPKVTWNIVKINITECNPCFNILPVNWSNDLWITSRLKYVCVKLGFWSYFTTEYEFKRNLGPFEYFSIILCLYWSKVSSNVLILMYIYCPCCNKSSPSIIHHWKKLPLKLQIFWRYWSVNKSSLFMVSDT